MRRHRRSSRTPSGSLRCSVLAHAQELARLPAPGFLAISNFKILVFEADGTPDRAFGTNGRAQLQVGVQGLTITCHSGSQALAVQDDGDIVLGG